MTYVVAVQPDLSLNIAAVGPFRSYQKAQDACRKMASEGPDLSNPQVVHLLTVQDYLSVWGEDGEYHDE